MGKKWKPCPFCGSDQIEAWYDDPFDGYQGPGLGYYKVTCRGCGAGINRKTEAEAWEAWDARAEEPVPVLLDVSAFTSFVSEEDRRKLYYEIGDLLMKRRAADAC